MNALKNLYDRIVQRVNINLRELKFDVNPRITNLIPFKQLVKFYAFYGISPNHLLDLHFSNANLAGSYFLGKCRVNNSILYKSDIRGDELKKKGDIFRFQDYKIQVSTDEGIEIEDSFLIKTLVHNFSHDPETLEKFFISNTISTHYANIHGSPTDGSYLGPFATVDLTTMNDCVIGAFSYVQAGEINHLDIEDGTIWVRSPDDFNFLYQYPKDRLEYYIRHSAGQSPQGLFIDFVDARKEDFQRIFNAVDLGPSLPVPDSASLDRFAVIKPRMHIGENVLVAQRAFLENTCMGKGANAQENCYIINSNLKGFNVTAHGAKIIEADLDENVFVGFNSFLQGRPDCRLTIGKDCVIMPHTIIDIQKPLAIPPGHMVWGLVTSQAELEANSISLDHLSKINGTFTRGTMLFEGNGNSFKATFRERIYHILEANGAFYDGSQYKGHAQRNQNISFNMIQPYPEGEAEGMYPTIRIQP
jgi:carbonic anhydrase/acetyltransferase-like protein (isoleucine patch superfamily)